MMAVISVQARERHNSDFKKAGLSQQLNRSAVSGLENTRKEASFQEGTKSDFGLVV